MVLKSPDQKLFLSDVPIPKPNNRQVLVKISACGICRTDLHILDGELPEIKYPLIPGHQIIGNVIEIGNSVNSISVGQRIGIPWLGGSCGKCYYCNNNKENLCDNALYTGYQINGGLAEYTVADADFCFPIPDKYPDKQAAPLLCAGLIGYRSYKMTGDGKNIGFYGFGSAAHILIQIANYENKNVYAFTRKSDTEGQEFAKKLGAYWVGESDTTPPIELDSAIIFALSGELVPIALRTVRKGGTVVCAGIHMSDIPSFPYSILWGERSLKSVANLTRKDGEEFLKIAHEIPIETQVNIYSLEESNKALDDLRHGRFRGSVVVLIH